jgi:hypothetical protein
LEYPGAVGIIEAIMELAIWNKGYGSIWEKGYLAYLEC